MRRTKISLLFLVFLWIIFFFIPLKDALAQESAEEVYEAAIFKKDAEGDLQGAIQLFLKVIAKFPENRKVAAKAQLQVGICYEKLGLKDAQKAFQKVIENYPEQADAVKMAKEKLDLLLKAQTVFEKGDKEFKIRQVCEGGVLDDVTGEVSPDGRYISYTDWGTEGLYIYEIATGKKCQLTEKDYFGSVDRSLWSPDSKQIAYTWWNEEGFYDLRLISLDGSKPRVLFRDKDVTPEPADWSPDGKYILAIFDNPALMKKDKISQVGLISVADGTVSALETLKGRDGYYMYFSPDGRYIAYDYPPQKSSQDRDIFIYSMEMKSEIALVEHSANDRLIGWTPDGQNILFNSDRLGTLDLWFIPVGEGKPQGSPKLIKKDIGLIWPMAFAPDGSFYYGQVTSMNDIYFATLDKERRKLVSPPEKLIKRLVGKDFSPEWSPDGKYLAYISVRHPQYIYGANSLFIMSMDTGEEREVVRPQQLRFFGQYLGGLRWSPDGCSIIASGFEKEKGQGIYTVDVKKGEISLAFYGEAKTSITDRVWSADSKAIFFTDNDWEKKSSRIFVYNLETKQKKEIYRQNDMFSTRLAISPDGRWLAFGTVDRERKSAAIKLFPVTGGESRELASIGTECMSMSWAPDSREIFYVNRLYTSTWQAKGSEIWKIPAEGGDPQKIWKTEEAIWEFRVHPDGQRIVFSTSKGSCEVWVMENFLPENKGKK